MAFSRVKDNFSKISVSTGYKVKSSKGWGCTTPYQRREAGQAGWHFLVGRVQVLLRIASDLPRGRVVGLWVCCAWGAWLGEMFLWEWTLRAPADRPGLGQLLILRPDRRLG